MIKIIPLNYEISGIKIQIPFSTTCSVVNKSFTGFVVVDYQPRQNILEYVSLEQEILEISKKPITAEEFTRKIFDIIIKAIEPNKLKILVDVQKSESHQPVQVWIEK
ncbi:MAG: GTP cyclohydrolase I [Patescibacteria group bacterium]|nr:GTP cyclohydrolase I [Patescibacteria group bacterium]